MEHKAYLHRSGRTARAGSEGVVVTICLPGQKQDLKTLLRKAAITVTPERVTAESASVTALVGDVAPYVKPAPRPAAGSGNGGGGRSQGANAQRKRTRRDELAAGGAQRPAGEGRRSRGRGRGQGSSDVAPATPRKDRSGRPAELKAHAPKQGAGQGRGAQATGASRSLSSSKGGASGRSTAKQPLRMGSLVSPSRNTRRAQG